jgi:hypothetical protein
VLRIARKRLAGPDPHLAPAPSARASLERGAGQGGAAERGGELTAAPTAAPAAAGTGSASATSTPGTAPRHLGDGQEPHVAAPAHASTLPELELELVLDSADAAVQAAAPSRRLAERLDSTADAAACTGTAYGLPEDDDPQQDDLAPADLGRLAASWLPYRQPRVPREVAAELCRVIGCGDEGGGRRPERE